VLAELVGVALREEAGVDLEKLVARQLTVGAVSLRSQTSHELKRQLITSISCKFVLRLVARRTVQQQSYTTNRRLRQIDNQGPN